MTLWNVYYACSGDYCIDSNSAGLPNSTTSFTQAVASVTDTALIIVGGLSVIFIVVGGLLYITSAGNLTRVKQAKDTITYSIVGLVIAASAFAIVTFITGRIF